MYNVHMTNTQHTHRRPKFLGATVFSLLSIAVLQQVLSVQGDAIGASLLNASSVRVSGHVIESSLKVVPKELTPAEKRKAARVAKDKPVTPTSDNAYGVTYQPKKRTSAPAFVLKSTPSQQTSTAIKASCGDGLVTGVEQCDDGNSYNNDGCSAVCAIESGYTCFSQPSICRSACGDGIQANNEKCDDGNNVSGDGCSADCKVELNWQCTGGVGSLSTCTPAPFCGDGTVQSGEDCDDGNNHDGDGCSHNCRVEPSYTCTGTSSVCTKTATPAQ